MVPETPLCQTLSFRLLLPDSSASYCRAPHCPFVRSPPPIITHSQSVPHLLPSDLPALPDSPLSPSPEPLGPVRRVHLTQAGSSSVTITWTGVPGATGYRVSWHSGHGRRQGLKGGLWEAVLNRVEVKDSLGVQVEHWVV